MMTKVNEYYNRTFQRGAVGSFGERLRREREMRGVSLDEIATATKIGTRSLKALEDENFSILPGGIFNKGFVRAYARFLGINEEEAIADYTVAVNEQPISVKTIAAQSAIAKANRLAAEQASESANAAGILRSVAVLLVAVAIVVGGYKAYRHGFFSGLRKPSLHRQMKDQPPTPVPVQESSQAPAAQTSPPAVPEAPVTQAPAQAIAPAPEKVSPASVEAMAAAEFVLSIKTSEPSWLSVTADGKRALQRTLQPNEQQEITAKDRIKIVIGNPNGTELSLNGRPLPIGGDLTRPRTVTVDASGLRGE